MVPRNSLPRGVVVVVVVVVVVLVVVVVVVLTFYIKSRSPWSHTNEVQEPYSREIRKPTEKPIFGWQARRFPRDKTREEENAHKKFNQ